MHRNTETSKLNIKGGGEPNRRRTTEKPQKLTIYRKKPVSNNMKPKQKLLKSQINMGNYVDETSAHCGSGEEKRSAMLINMESVTQACLHA